MKPGYGMWQAAPPPAQTCIDNEQTLPCLSVGGGRKMAVCALSPAALSWKRNDFLSLKKEERFTFSFHGSGIKSFEIRKMHKTHITDPPLGAEMWLVWF